MKLHFRFYGLIAILRMKLRFSITNLGAYSVYFKSKKELNYNRFVDPNILGAARLVDSDLRIYRISFFLRDIIIMYDPWYFPNMSSMLQLTLFLSLCIWRLLIIFAVFKIGNTRNIHDVVLGTLTQAQDVEPMLSQCWTSVFDADLSLCRHWFNNCVCWGICTA